MDTRDLTKLERHVLRAALELLAKFAGGSVATAAHNLITKLEL